MEKQKFQNIISPLLIVLAAFIWGVSFVAQSEGGEMGSFTFQAIRCTLAFLSILVVVLIRDNAGKSKTLKKQNSGIKELIKANKYLFKAGLACGIALTVGSIFQQLGIDMQGKEVSTGRAAFLTALYIIIVPILGIFLKKKVGFFAWISVAIGALGMYFISIQPDEGFFISTPDILLIICAFGFAVQIMIVDKVSLKVDGVKLSCLQFLVTAIISCIFMFIFEKPDINIILDNALPLFYSGCLSGGVAYTLQIIGQKHCNHILAPLLMSLESVFSALADWVIRGNSMSEREILGCVILFAAIIFAQLPEFKIKKGSKI